MKAIGGSILIFIGLGIIVYKFRTYKKEYGIKQSWLKMLMFIIEVLGEEIAALGLLLIIVGLFLVFS